MYIMYSCFVLETLPDLSMGARIRGDSVPVHRSPTDARVWEYGDDYYLVSAGDLPPFLPRPVAVRSVMTLSGTTPCVTAPTFLHRLLHISPRCHEESGFELC